MTRLLVSVRSVAETEAALRGGADIIDIKEPRRGSLGRAEPEVIAAIVDRVAGRVPVSVALGEWSEFNAEGWNHVAPLVPARGPEGAIQWYKFGLAGCRHLAAQPLEALASHFPSGSLVLAAYADAERAAAPDVWQVLEHLPRWHGQILLIDTWQKDGHGLLAWLSLSELQRLRQETARRDVLLALAGSLTTAEFPEVAQVQPDILAVRGAACREGSRTGEVEVERVAALRQLLSHGRG